MTQPLALLLYERVMPGSQLANQLRDAGYRVVKLHQANELAAIAERDHPLFAIVDLPRKDQQATAAIAELRRNPQTAHVPVIAIGNAQHPDLEESARTAGATLVTSETGILHHLKPLIDQALQLD
jgi:CheY-like chemotaxis protein